MEGTEALVALVDGHLPQIAHLQQMAEERNIPLILVVDFIHVAQYVGRRGGLFPQPGDRTRSLDARAPAGNSAREGQSGRGGMRRSATLREMAAAERKPVDDCADYLLNYAPYLQYDKALAEGFPSPLGSLKAPVVIWSRTG